MSKHTLSVLVDNQPGVLARVAGLFSRRAFNIHSLAVGPTEHPDISRITVVVDVEGLPLEQVTKQLNKLVHVLKIVELEPEKSVLRELLLIKVRCDVRQRAEILQLVDLFRAHVVDVTQESLVIEVVGTTSKLDAFMAALASHEVRELVQSGVVAIGRGSRSITERPLDRPGPSAAASE